jgi:hypothetical protein
VPANLYSAASKLPIVGDDQMKKKANKMQKLISRVRSMTDLFGHFTVNDWVYESLKIEDYLAKLSQEDKNEFQIDVKSIDWAIAVARYGYGIERYIFK